MNELTIFNNNEFGEIRTLEENGVVLFCGNDVARALGYQNPSRDVQRHCKAAQERCTTDSVGRQQKMLFIPESDLYRLTFSSKLPIAEKFTDWVTSEVLPSIRRTGTYTVRTIVEKNPLDEKRLAVDELNVKSRIADQMMKLWTAAGVEPQYQAVAMQDYYPNLSLPRQALAEHATAMLDATTIAKHLGVLSKSGTPHAQAVTAIIHQLQLSDGECAMTPYTRNGHDGVSIQYTENVERKVADWLNTHDYPGIISDGKKNYAVRYKDGL